MNVTITIANLMTKQLRTVEADDKLELVKKLMDEYSIHHIPVCDGDRIIGLISQTDLYFFLKGIKSNSYQNMLNDMRLRNYVAKEIMTTQLTTLKPDDTVMQALEIFRDNNFKAIPIVENERLVGILSTYDIINKVLETFKEKT